MATSTIKKGLDVLAATRNGTPIALNTDLDTLGRGVYYSSSSSTTNTLSNCPITGVAFRLLVIDSGYLSDTYSMQVILTGATQSDTAFWYRKKSLSSGSSWAGWHKIVGTAV